MYRWWTVLAWRDRNWFGVKLGPVSVGVWRWPPYDEDWCVDVWLLNWWGGTVWRPARWRKR